MLPIFLLRTPIREVPFRSPASHVTLKDRKSEETERQTEDQREEEEGLLCYTPELHRMLGIASEDEVGGPCKEMWLLV